MSSLFWPLQAAEAREARGKDPDYLRRQRKVMEEALGPDKTPLFKSTTKLVFDKKEKVMLTQFLYAGAKGIGLEQTGRAHKGKAYDAMCAAEASVKAHGAGHAPSFDLRQPLGMTVDPVSGVVNAVKAGTQAAGLGLNVGCVVQNLDDLTCVSQP
jgi:hypothetical protein